MGKGSLTGYKALLVTLITSLAITGIGFLDDEIWNIVMLVVGLISYAVVGFLFSSGVICGKNSGKETYTAVFIILLIVGFYFYQGIVGFQKWLVEWPLWAKILIPSVLVFAIAVIIIVMIFAGKKRAKISKKIEDGGKHC